MRKARPGPVRRIPLKYPLVDAVIEEKGGVYHFLEASGVKTATYYYLQSGKGNPTMRTINAILDYTGLTYEEAFRTKNAAQRVQDAERR